MSAGWLCERELAPTQSWASDAYWIKANERHGHRVALDSPAGIQFALFSLGFVEGMKNFVHQLFYGNPIKNDREMTGLANYYSSRNPAQAQNAVNIVDGHGKSENLNSAWIVVWGPRSVFMATPNGEPLKHGEAALVIADWRFVVRVANIDMDIETEKLDALLTSGWIRLPLPPGILQERKTLRPVIYMDSRLAAKLPMRTWRGLFVRPMDLRNDEPRVT